MAASYTQLFPKEKISLKFKKNTKLPKILFERNSLVIFKKENG